MHAARIDPHGPAISLAGGPHGALLAHGFGGAPETMRPLADALASAGLAVECPLLPGHGTTIEDLDATRWSDWSDALQRTYEELVERCDRIVLVGFSLGATLIAELAGHERVAGLAVLNGLFEAPPAGLQAALDAAAAQGERFLPDGPPDCNDPAAVVQAYDAWSVNAARSVSDAVPGVIAGLGVISCPVLVLVSPQDRVVPASSADALAAAVSGPVRTVTLERSGHVAPLDYDRRLVTDELAGFATACVVGEVAA